VTWRWRRSWCWRPRATRLPAPDEEPNDDENDAPEPPPPEAPDPDEHDAGPPPPQPDAQDLQDLVLQAALAALPPGLLALLAAGTLRSPGTGGRAGAQAASKRRGRPVGSRRGDPRTGARLHLIDTLRAAAPVADAAPAGGAQAGPAHGRSRQRDVGGGDAGPTCAGAA
jgi:magnesium chelatase subunit D